MHASKPSSRSFATSLPAAIFALIAGLLALAAPAARADNAAVLPPLCDPATVLRPLVAAGVRFDRETVCAAWEEYLRGAERLHAESIEEWVRLYRPEEERAFMSIVRGAAEQRKREERETRMIDAHAAMRTALFAKLAEATTPANRELVEAALAVQRVRDALWSITGAALGRRGEGRSSDIGIFLLDRGFRLAPLPLEDARRCLLAAATDADARVDASTAARKAIRAAELEEAKGADQEGFGGMTELEGFRIVSAKWDEQAAAARAANQPQPPRPDDSRVNVRFQGCIEAAGPETPVGARIVAVQRVAVRTLLPQLPETERARVRDWWIRGLLNIDRTPPGTPLLPGGLGYRGVGPVIINILRVQGLDDASKARVREIGRTWMREDQAIVERAVQAFTAEGPLPNAVAEREARARQAMKELASIRGLELLGGERPTLPALAPADEVAPDLTEFGEEMQRTAESAGATMQGRIEFFGVTFGYAKELQRLTRLLRLTEAQQQVLTIVFRDAEEQWRSKVPSLAEYPERPAWSGRDAQAQIASFEAAAEWRAAIRRARAAVREAAAASDATTFEAVAAALGDDAVRGTLDAVRTARLCLDGMTSDGQREEETCILQVVLEAPLSADGRLRATLAVTPRLQAWMQARRDAVEREIEARTKDEASRIASLRINSAPGAGVEPEWAAAEHTWRQALTDAKQAFKHYKDQSDALAAAVEAALPADDLRRWKEMRLMLQRPKNYADLRRLWADVDAAIEALSEGQRESIRSAAAAPLDALSAMVRRVGDRTRPATEAIHPDFTQSADAIAVTGLRLSDAAALIARARVEGLLPAGQRLGPPAEPPAFSISDAWTAPSVSPPPPVPPALPR